ARLGHLATIEQVDTAQAALSQRSDQMRMTLSALERIMLMLSENLAGADGALRESMADVRMALEIAVSEQRLDHAAAVEQIGQFQTLVAQRLGQTRASLEASLADARDEAVAHMQALEPSFKELFARARFLERAACSLPIYAQPGMSAIMRVGNWNELPIAVPSTHVGVLSTYYGVGAHALERGVRALIRRELKPHDVALDIGA